MKLTRHSGVLPFFAGRRPKADDVQEKLDYYQNQAIDRIQEVLF